MPQNGMETGLNIQTSWRKQCASQNGHDHLPGQLFMWKLRKRHLTHEHWRCPSETVRALCGLISTRSPGEVIVLITGLSVGWSLQQSFRIINW